MEFEMAISNRTRIEAVFSDLEQRGIIARADFWCCLGCGSSAMWNQELPRYERNGQENQPVGYVFFHEQDTDGANEGRSLYLAHGSINEGYDDTPAKDVEHAQRLAAHIIIEEFQEHGFEVEWSGKTGERIQVLEPSGGWDLAYDRHDEDDEDEDEECPDCGASLSWDGECPDNCQDEDEDED